VQIREAQSVQLYQSVLTKTHLDVRYRAFELFLEQPKVLKERKNVTSRIVTKEDIDRVLRSIAQARQEGERS
jgi:hypothetical protein